MIFTDQLNRSVEVGFPPQRMISLVPSQTELLFDLGLSEKVIGITQFCVHPEEWFRTKTRVGGTKKINFEAIAGLDPDLIIGNKEENEKGQIEALMEKYPVWMSDVKSFSEAVNMITSIGALTGRKERSVKIAEEITAQFKKLDHCIRNQEFSGQRVAYIIWRKPFIAAGKNTFINEMLERCGMTNVFSDSEKRYPEISPGKLQEAAPGVIILSSEPYPFSDRHREEFQKICPGARIILADGEMFSWYGSRLLKAPDYFLNLLDTLKDQIKV